jgi:putative DNA primase/helicase
MHTAGLSTDDPITPDGVLHRFCVEGDKRGARNGWYVLYANGVPAGEFGSWKIGGSETWCANIGRTLSQDEQAAMRAQMEAAKRQREKELIKVRADARKKAEKLWAEASPRVSTKHPYLVRKQVRAYGIRQLRRALVIPVRDVEGALHGLQFIQDDPGGTKRFTSGMAKAGHYHPIGKQGAVLLVAEGYATGATLHQATDHAVAVAFDAGNLRSVAEALRRKFPRVRIIIGADNDHRTTGNPGLSKAQEAAEACGGEFLAPEFESGADGTDWNDYAALHGLEAVREAFSRPVLPSPAQTVTDSPKATAEPSAQPSPGDKEPRRPRFTLGSNAVWWHGIDKDGEQLPPYWVCPPLEVTAYLRDLNSENWGRLLVFRDKDGLAHRWGMPMRLLSGGCDEMRAELLRLGFDVPVQQKNRNHLTDYIQQSRPERSARCVERAGWHGRVFVMPERTIGDGDEEVLFQSETIGGHIYRECGALEQWRSDVADLCRDNSRLLFAVSAAFAAPLLHWAGEESGGFHLRGGSSSGKTTALRVAASVWGAPDFMRRWRATDNGLESIAAQYSDGLLILDELGQLDPKIAGEAAYMLANGEGKARAARGGAARAVYTWRLLFLSAGEISLADHMRSGGKQVQAGQETRLADIPADAGKGLGVFDTLRGFSGGNALSRALTEAAKGCEPPRFSWRLVGVSHAAMARPGICE